MSDNDFAMLSHRLYVTGSTTSGPVNETAETFPSFITGSFIVWYRWWKRFLTLLALLFMFITPLQFAFVDLLPKILIYLELVGFIFLPDLILQVYATYTDTHYVTRWRHIVIYHLPDIIACVPWVFFYHISGKTEEDRTQVYRWISLLRILRMKYVHQVFSKEDLRVEFISTRVLKIVYIKLLAVHMGACAYFYSAMHMPPDVQDKTWLGAALTTGITFRTCGVPRLYLISLYFSAIFMTTIGLGDIHPVSNFDMGTAIIISQTLTFLEDYTNGFKKQPEEMTKLLKLISSTCQEPLVTRLQRLRELYRPCIQGVSLFSGCTIRFIDEIASRVHEERFQQGAVVVEKGFILEYIYFIASGKVEMLSDAEIGGPQALTLTQHDYFGGNPNLENVASSFDVKVLEPCTLLRLKKQTLKNMMSMYDSDGMRVKEKLAQVVINDVQKDKLMRAAKVNILTSFDDVDSIREEPDVNLQDLCGMTALHIAASKGLEQMTRMLIEEKGADMNLSDNSGCSPLMLAIKGNHDNVVGILTQKGAALMIQQDHGDFLCSAVATDDAGYVRRLLECGLVANSQSTNGLTPLHIAARRGNIDIVKLLVQNGAKPKPDRSGQFPLDEVGLDADIIDILGTLEE